MSPEVRDLLNRVEAIGWEPDGYDGNGHIVMVHTSGQRTSIPATPSDHRSTTNSLLMLERIGGQKLPRVNKRRSRKSTAVVADPSVEASRRRHAETWDARVAEREAQRDAEIARAEDARRIELAERKRREIESLMRGNY